MKSSINRAIASFVIMAAVGSAVFFAGGCKAMADPENTDLNWAERPEWEFAPAVPSSMLNP